MLSSPTPRLDETIKESPILGTTKEPDALKEKEDGIATQEGDNAMLKLGPCGPPRNKLNESRDSVLDLSLTAGVEYEEEQEDWRKEKENSASVLPANTAKGDTKDIVGEDEKAKAELADEISHNIDVKNDDIEELPGVVPLKENCKAVGEEEEEQKEDPIAVVKVDSADASVEEIGVEIIDSRDDCSSVVLLQNNVVIF